VIFVPEQIMSVIGKWLQTKDREYSRLEPHERPSIGVAVVSTVFSWGLAAEYCVSDPTASVMMAGLGFLLANMTNRKLTHG
jgi:hypothetical protein